MNARTFLVACPILLAFLLPEGLASADDTKHNNVVIVLDASGSMGETMRGTSTRKIDAAKQALKAVLKTVPEDTQIGVLVFSASNLSNDWIYPLGPRDDEKLMQAIDKPEPGGRTPLGKYTKKGADALLAQRGKQYGYGSYRLLIVTDGEAGDPELVDSYVPEVMARGITIDAIGVDMRSNHTLATKVHSYRRADDPRSLKTAVADVFAEVADTGSDSADQDAFDQLAAIPDEMAGEMLKALSASGNHPIGDDPPVEDAEVADKASSPKKKSPSAAPSSDSDGGWGSKTVIFIIVAVFFTLALIRKFAKKR